MGNKHTNYTFRCADLDVVIEKFPDRTMFLSPPVDGTVVLYDSDTEFMRWQTAHRLGRRLSKSLRTPVLSILNFDDCVLAYLLFDDGVVMDEFVSEEDFGNGPRPKGDPNVLCAAFDKPEAEQEVRKILGLEPGRRFTFEPERHQALCEALGLPTCAVGFGYNYLVEGEFPEEPDEDEFLECVADDED